MLPTEGFGEANRQVLLGAVVLLHSDRQIATVQTQPNHPREVIESVELDPAVLPRSREGFLPLEHLPSQALATIVRKKTEIIEVENAGAAPVPRGESHWIAFQMRDEREQVLPIGELLVDR